MKHFSNILASALISLTVIACADDDFRTGWTYEKPQEVANNEFLQSFAELKTYIDLSAIPNFKLGMGMALADFTAEGPMKSIAITNFNEVSLNNVFFLGTVMGDDGTMDFGSIRSGVEVATASNLSLYGSALMWHKNQDAAYFKKMFTPIVVPPRNEEGTTDVLEDFEKYPIGTNFEMTSGGGGTSTVVEDPAGLKGKVLHIGEGGVVVQKFPKIPITLPEGLTLGNLTRLKINANFKAGQYGSGMRVGINDNPVTAFPNAVTSGAQMNNWDGTLSFDLTTIPLSDADKKLTSFTLVVGSATGGGDYYYDAITFDWAIKEMGDDMVANFESNALGDTYAMSGNGQAVVEDDPQGQSGKVIHLSGPATNSYLKIPVKLTTGRTLGDYEYVALDLRATGSSGLYGSGMRMYIEGSAEHKYNSPSSYGCPDGAWGRGLIQMQIADLGLTDEQKKLTEFTLILGSGTGSGDYYMDNIKLHWVGQTKYIEMTPEEKKDTLLTILDTYISGVMATVDGGVTSWTAINEPMDDANPIALKSDSLGEDVNNFYWQDYLGMDYAREVIRMARMQAQNLQLYVNDYGLEHIEGKCDGLIGMINYWESDGVTKIDGIGTEMLLTYSLDATKQAANESGVTDMLQKLAASGKVIRITQLEIGLADADGVAIASPTYDQQVLLGAYYKFVIKKYMELIPASQRGGISLESPIGAKGLWYANSYDRMATYSGFADGLAGK